MNRRRLKLVLAIGVMSLLGAVGVAVATGGKDVRERLTGYEEIPTLSSPASGEFKARLSRFSDEIHWRLSYRGFTTDVSRRTSTSAPARSTAASASGCASAVTAAPAGTQSARRAPGRSRA